MSHLLTSNANVNAINEPQNSALHWAALTGQTDAVKLLIEQGGDVELKNENGRTPGMEAAGAGKEDVVVMILKMVKDEASAAASMGVDQMDDDQVQQVAAQAGVDQTIDSEAIKTWQEAPAEDAPLPATRDLSGETVRDNEGKASADALDLAKQELGDAPVLMRRLRPEPNVQIEERVQASVAARKGDWRYSEMPAVVSVDKMVQLSTDFFSTTGLLTEDGNTFGAEFEQQYAGHKNYFYYMNRQQVIPGSEKAAFIFEELDHYTRQVMEVHHPGMALKLDRAFGAYYEGEREGFHLGVNEHCDGDANLVSAVVHATLPDGDVGFSEGGQLTVSEIGDLPAIPVSHTNDTVGSVVYLGGSVFHHATPINVGGKRLVFCMFYATADNTDLSKHAFA